MASMRIQVIYPNGQRATLELRLPVTTRLGEELNAIADADGVEHFFNAEDGTYDGWERSFDIKKSSGVTIHPMPEEPGFFKRTVLLRRLRRVK